jgi:hypothetical protein
MEPKQQR